AAALAPALALTLALGFADPALAQRTPHAAPTGERAQTQELTAPSAATTTTVDVTQTGGSMAPAVDSISIVSLFSRADLLVKVVLIVLLLASLWSWAIIFNKWMMMGTLR